MRGDGTAGSDLLLSHGGFIRALARDLVRDDATADDVAQEVMLAALRRPPATDRPVRPWLATVVRNAASKLRRGEARRSARERRVGAVPTRREPAPDDASLRLDVHRALVDEVARLDEPFRSTVIQRYFDDLSTDEIAAREGCPPSTVRTRLKRGLDRLRERLDARHGGQRDTWLAALAFAREGGDAGGSDRRGTPPERSPADAEVPQRLPRGRAGLRVAVVALAGVAAWWAFRDAGPEPLMPVEMAAAPEPRASAPSGRPVPESRPVARRRGRTPKSAPDEAAVRRVVQGRVVAEDGTGVAGATLEVSAVTPSVGSPVVPSGALPAEAPVAVASGFSGADGGFVVAGAPAAALRVVARHPRFVSADTAANATDGDVQGIVLSLRAGTRLRGTLTAADGRPLDGSEVVVERATSGRQRLAPVGGGATVGNLVWEIVGTLRPDVRGEWETVLPWERGDFQVRALGPGRVDAGPVAVRLSPECKEEVVHLEFARAGSFGGVVVSKATGRPVSGAKVVVAGIEGLPLGYGGGHRAAPPVAATTDEAGAFRIDLVAEGTYSVTATAAGFARGEARGRAPGEVRVELPSVEETTIAGRVRFADGRPAHPFEVYAVGEMETHSFRHRAQTATDGSFVLKDMEPGRWKLRAWRGRDLAAASALPAEAGPLSTGARDVEIVVQPAKSLVGRVVDEAGAPIAKAPVNALPETAGAAPRGTSGFVYSDADGNFRLDGLGDGPYELIVHAPMDRESEFAVIREGGRRAGEAPVVVVLRAGLAIAGRIVGPDGRPLERGSIRAMPLDEGAPTEPVFWRSARVGKDGRFAVRGIGSGTYRLQLFGFDADLRPANAVLGPTRPPSLVLVGGERVAAGARDVLVTATTGLHVRGRVTDVAGVPLRGAQVWVRVEGSKDTVMLYSDADGAFDACGFDDGVLYRVESYLAGFRSTKLANVRAGGEVVQIRMERGVTVTGRVLDADGAPVSGARLEFVPSEGATAFNLGHGETSSDGAFTAGALEVRAYRVRVALWSPGTRETRWVDAGTVEGGDQHVTLRLVR